MNETRFQKHGNYSRGYYTRWGAHDYVFHQVDAVESILESFRSLLKRCESKCTKQSDFSGAASPENRKIYCANYYPKREMHHFRGTEDGETELPLTDSFERCYVQRLRS